MADLIAEWDILCLLAESSCNETKKHREFNKQGTFLKFPVFFHSFHKNKYKSIYFVFHNIIAIFDYVEDKIRLGIKNKS